jgi:hypothetical protein
MPNHIPDEAVEAAAQKIGVSLGGGGAMVSSGTWRMFKAAVRLGLEAAAPYIRAQALAEARERVEAQYLDIPDPPNPVCPEIFHNTGIDAALTALEGSSE